MMFKDFLKGLRLLKLNSFQRIKKGKYAYNQIALKVK